MFTPTALETSKCQIRRSGVQFGTISLEEEKLVMVQQREERGKVTDLNGDSILKDLIKRSREGEVQAIEAIYARYNRSLLNLVFRYTYNREVAEDLLQDVFLKIFTKLHTLKNEETFVSWMYRIAINTCFSYLRGSKNQLQRTIPLDDVEGKIGDEASEAGDRIMKKSLENAIQSLPNKLRTIFLLHDVQGFKHEEIAGILRCSVGTSKSQLFKARMKIRDLLENKQVS